MTPPRRNGVKKFIDKVPHTVVPYSFPALSAVHFLELPNNGFGQQNYHIQKTKFGHWPVYLKIQNTKFTTEIKRIKGDLVLFKADLLRAFPGLEESHVQINTNAGYVNVKGDLVKSIKSVFDSELK